MPRTITISIAIICFITRADAQHSDAAKLLNLEQQAFACSSDSSKNWLYIKKLDVYLQASDYKNAALNEVKRIDYTLIKDEAEKERFLWNASLLAQLNEDVHFAEVYFSRYQTCSRDSGAGATLLGMIILSNTDTAALTRAINYSALTDPAFSCLTCLNKTLSYKRKNRGVFILSSALIPGMGSMLNGNYLQGTNSLLINGAIGYLIFTLVQSNDYVNAVLLGFSLGLKFYNGNIRLTKSLFDKKEARKKSLRADKCRQALKQLMEKYPLSFRLNS